MENKSQKTTRAVSQAQTREKLITAAQELFTQHGLNGTSIDKIVAKAGFSKGAFYSNFASKEDLMLSLLRKHKDDTFESFADLIEKSAPEDLLDQIEKWLIDGNQDKDWIIFNYELAINAARNPEFSADYAEFMAAQYKALEETLSAIFAKLNLKPKIPICELAVIIKQLSHSAALQSLAEGGGKLEGRGLVAFLRKIAE